MLCGVEGSVRREDARQDFFSFKFLPRLSDEMVNIEHGIEVGTFGTKINK
jgi:hypothetical protein